MPKLPEKYTTITKFSKTIALVMFILLPFIGFYIGMSYQRSIDSITMQPRNAQGPTVSNTVKSDLDSQTQREISKSSETNPNQSVETLLWKEFTNNELGLSFIYPENLNSICVNKTGDALETLYTESGELNITRVCSGMSYLFSVGVMDRTDKELDEWFNTNKTSFKEGDISRTVLGDLPAYMYRPNYEQQVPTNSFVVKQRDNILLVEVMRTENTDQFNAQIVNKILASIKFK